MIPLDPDASHPQREDYAALTEYERAFHLWRALRRDALLTPAESRAKLDALADALGGPWNGESVRHRDGYEEE